jgi:hypothetical protein
MTCLGVPWIATIFYFLILLITWCKKENKEIKKGCDWRHPQTDHSNRRNKMQPPKIKIVIKWYTIKVQIILQLWKKMLLVNTHWRGPNMDKYLASLTPVTGITASLLPFSMLMRPMFSFRAKRRNASGTTHVLWSAASSYPATDREYLEMYLPHNHDLHTELIKHACGGKHRNKTCYEAWIGMLFIKTIILWNIMDMLLS